MSAKQLQRQLGCRYQTAWFVLHRLRRGMVSDTRSRLAGRVEADEVIVGGPVRGKRGRGVTKAVHSTLVFGAVEVIAYTDKHGEKMEKAGRLRLALTQRADAVSIRLRTHSVDRDPMVWSSNLPLLGGQSAIQLRLFGIVQGGVRAGVGAVAVCSAVSNA